MSAFAPILLIVFILAIYLIARNHRPRSLSASKTKPELDNDLLWNALIEWEWKKTSHGWVINADSISKKCPNCENELEYQVQGGYYFLFCPECRFISNEFAYEANGDEANAEHLFLQELNKKIGV